MKARFTNQGKKCYNTTNKLQMEIIMKATCIYELELKKGFAAAICGAALADLCPFLRTGFSKSARSTAR